MYKSFLWCKYLIAIRLPHLSDDLSVTFSYTSTFSSSELMPTTSQTPEMSRYEDIY